MSGFIADLKHALRLLLKSRVFTLCAIVILGLGIGASTAVFSVVDHILFRPLGLRDADRVITVCEVHESLRGACIASTPNMLDWAEQSRTIETIGAARTEASTIRFSEGARLITTGITTPGYLRALGATTLVGRLIDETDMLPASDGRVAVLTHEFWRTELGGDPDVVGRSLSLDGESHTIVGVLAPETRMPMLNNARIWRPLPWDPDTPEYREWRGFRTAALLAPGASAEEARAELEVIQAALASAYPDTVEGWGVDVRPLREQLVGHVRPMLMLFLAAVGVVLVIVCVNMAGLLMTRATARRREMVVRTALGAGPRRIARQLFTESALLAALGGAAGIIVAYWSVRTLVAVAPPGIPRIEEVTVDGRVLAIAIGLTALVGLLFGVMPAARAGRFDLASALRQGRAASADRATSRIRRGLVVAQVALAVVLLAGAGLLARSFVGLLDWRPGFETEGILTFQVFPSPENYADIGEVLALYRDAEDVLGALPGVVSVGTASAGPLFGGGDGASPFVIEGRTDPSSTDSRSVEWFDVGPGYFETLGLTIVEGRGLEERDGPGTTPVALINQAMARYWSGENPLGSTVSLPALETSAEIVGIVPNVEPFFAGQPPEPQIYLSNRQRTRGATYFVLRTDADPRAVAGPATAAMQRLDPDLVPVRVQTMEELAAERLVRPRFNMSLVGLFALVALLLGVAGIYGIVSYSVEIRLRDVGVRIALGADSGRIWRQVVREGLTLVVLGVSIGILVAAGFTRLVSQMLYGISPFDPLTLAGTIAVMILAAVAASAVPAIRASRVDPLRVLQQE